MENIVDYCKSQIEHYKLKSDHNKRESLIFFWTALLGSILSPIFISLGEEISLVIGYTSDNNLFPKIIPVIISGLAAFSTAWLQLRKPNQLWSLYRTTQKELEYTLNKYIYGIDEFSNLETKNILLAKKTLEIVKDTHYSWVSVVPDTKKVKNK